jgi:hypothetical protein
MGIGVPGIDAHGRFVFPTASGSLPPIVDDNAISRLLYACGQSG